MAIKKKDPRKKPDIDLDGPDGNAYVLLGTAQGAYRQIGKDYFKVKFGKISWDEIFKEMTASDYEHLLKKFDQYFGAFFDLGRS